MRPNRAFSLVEVVIAVGLLATGVAAILGLMAASTKMIGEASERHGGERVLSNGIAELDRLGFVAATARLTADSTTPSQSNQYFESREGERSGWGSAVATVDRFYAFTAYRLADITPSSSDASGQGAAILLRVEWPAAAAERTSIQSTHVLLR